jgi:bifunctional non-homologous end joining protein LigD
MARASIPKTKRSVSTPAGTRRAKSDSGPPPFRPVQLATLVDTVPTGDRWLHEMKYDGYRLAVAVGGGTARAYTRSGLD